MRFAVIWSSSLVDPAVLLAALPRRCYQGKSSLHFRIVHAADPLFVAESQNCMAQRIWKIQTFPLLKNTIADQFLLLRTKVPQILSSISEPHLRIIATGQALKFTREINFRCHQPQLSAPQKTQNSIIFLIQVLIESPEGRGLYKNTLEKRRKDLLRPSGLTSRYDANNTLSCHTRSLSTVNSNLPASAQ